MEYILTGKINGKIVNITNPQSRYKTNKAKNNLFADLKISIVKYKWVYDLKIVVVK
jgi:hypothetical protein